MLRDLFHIVSRLCHPLWWFHLRASLFLRGARDGLHQFPACIPTPCPPFRNPGNRKPFSQWSQQSPVLSLIGPLSHLPTCKPVTGAGFDGVRGEIHGLAWSALPHVDWEQKRGCSSKRIEVLIPRSKEDGWWAGQTTDVSFCGRPPWSNQIYWEARHANQIKSGAATGLPACRRIRCGESWLPKQNLGICHFIPRFCKHCTLIL